MPRPINARSSRLSASAFAPTFRARLSCKRLLRQSIGDAKLGGNGDGLESHAAVMSSTITAGAGASDW